MKRIIEKIGLTTTTEKCQADAAEPGPSTPSLDTIRSLLVSQKATRGAYFFFNSFPVSLTVNAATLTRASLLSNELTRRGLKSKRLLFRPENDSYTAPVGILVFAIDQQAAQRLSLTFKPDDAFWCDRLRPAVSLKSKPL